MIPLLYEKDGINKIGELSNCIECLVEEERNGLFELTIVYPTTDSIFNSLEEENIIVCNANDTLKNQKFRIYMTKKLMSNRIEVYARHISFDLAYDRVDSINITNQSCEYSLNAIFKQSQFSTNYRGYSDIINAQNYTIANVNCIEAIAGKQGSIIDTYGTGAEILRDNTNIHVLNRRGNDNEVTIEYAKNLTGFELEEDFSELVTRINASAKYTDTETNKVVIVEAKGIDSPLISNYSHPYISHFDYSDKFEEGEKPTSEKLIALAKKEYSVNNKDKPKQNFKIEFIPLSKCVGYEDLEDKISLCDTVTIIDARYGVNTKAKVIRVVFNVLKDRYESMELGEPRTTLGDIIGTGGNTSDVEDLPTAGPQGPPGQDGTNGVDGVDAIYVNLTNDSHIVPTLSDGTGGNYTGCETTIELYKGADKLNYGVSYEAEQIEGVTASLKGNVYSISNMTVDRCNVGLRATYNGKTYLKYFNVSKSKKGQDGTNGTNGTTYYTWIRYADDSEGNGISDDPTDKEYIGFAYNKITPIESNVPGDYTWSLIKGTDGVPGQNGTDGTTYYTWIKYSDNANGSPCYDVPTSNTKYIGIATNKTSPKESEDPGVYIWSKFKGDDGVNGADGITYYTWIKYADDLQGNGISNDPLNKDCIGFAYNKTTSIESDNPKDYSWSLIKGAEGVPGEPGEDGNTYYTWIKYSDFESGNPCYDTPTNNTKYIGIATNKPTPTESSDHNDYKWSKFRGDDGVDGTNGIDGTDGKDAYTINITNDSHIFAAESDGKILKQQSTTTEIVAFKGIDTVPFTIGELPLVPGLGLAKDSTTVSITAFVGYDLEETGSFEIPIIIEGLTFKKVFSWSKAKKGVDGSLGDFPDTLPTVPTLEYELYGFSNIGLNWTFENKMYYQYELYASKTKDFTPNTFDLIHQGQTSSFLFQARPSETWYFKVCGINSHGRRTGFSNQVAVTTKKIDNMSNYFEEAAIGNAVVGSLTADYMTAGIIKGNWIDAKQLSVTDGNNKRTLDIDSFGNVALDVTSLKITNKVVATEEFTNNKSNTAYNNALKDSKGYTNNQISNVNSQISSVKSEIGVMNGKIDLKVSKDKIVNQINVSTEGIKIKANKIQLEGTTTLGEGGRKVKIENANYSVIDGSAEKAFFGFKNFENSYLVPKFYMGAYGFDPDRHNYFGMTSYRGESDNPESSTYAYHDMSYRCVNSVFSDWSNIKMYSSGDIRLAPVRDLVITTNYLNGSYQNAEERKLASFNTANSSIFNSHLQIGCIRNMDNKNGLILADDSNSGNDGTRVRVHVDSSGNKFFRPVTNAGNIELGSGSFPWKAVFSKNAYSSEGVLVNTEAKVINNITIDNVLDNINFPNDNVKALNNEEGIKIDVTNLQGTRFVDISDGYAYIDNSEMIKLLLKEVKELKEEIKLLKSK